MDTGADTVLLTEDHRVATHQGERRRLDAMGAVIAPIDISGALRWGSSCVVALLLRLVRISRTNCCCEGLVVGALRRHIKSYRAPRLSSSGAKPVHEWSKLRASQYKSSLELSREMQRQP